MLTGVKKIALTICFGSKNTCSRQCKAVLDSHGMSFLLVVNLD